jgi:hypothetical protein
LLPTCFEVEKKFGFNCVKGYNQSTSTTNPGWCRHLFHLLRFNLV